MNITKYLTEKISKIKWTSLSSDTRQSINRLEDAAENVNRISELLDDVVQNAYQDGYDKGYVEGNDDGKRDGDFHSMGYHG